MIPRLRQVQIQSFKSIGRAVVDLEPFTALVGANGSGKSNFLDGLRFVQDCLSQSPGEASGSRRGDMLTPRWQAHAPESTGFRLRIDLGDVHSADYSFAIRWDKAASPRVTHELCRVTDADREHVFEVVDGAFRRDIPGIRAQIQADRLALAIASATEEFRPVYDFLASMKFYSINPVAVKVDAPATRDFLVSTGTNASEILSRFSPGSEALQHLNQLLSKVVPGLLDVHTRERWSGNLELEFTQELGTGEPGIFSASEMSDGTLRILGLLLALYQPYRFSLAAIEEPEATVHPAAAELVLQVLLDAAEERQVLITTHSPDILDAKEISDQQIRVVTMTHGRTAIAPLSQASRQAIREHLYTPGELLRSNELNQDAQAAAAAAEHLDLFDEVAAGRR